MKVLIAHIRCLLYLLFKGMWKGECKLVYRTEEGLNIWAAQKDLTQKGVWYPVKIFLSAPHKCVPYKEDK